MTQTTVANCWVKSDILPFLHASQLRQDSGTYDASAIEDLCSLLRSSSLQSLNEDDSLQPSEQQMLGEFEALDLQLNQDPAGLTALLEDWFTIEDSEIVKLDEVEMILDATTTDQDNPPSSTPGSEDLECDANDCLEQSAEPS